MRRGSALARALGRCAAALAAGLASCAAPEAARETAQGGACRVERVAELGARLVEDQLVVAVELDGESAEFLVDTGASRSLVTPEAARRLGLRPDPGRSVPIPGAGGSIAGAGAAVRRALVGPNVLDPRGITVGPMPTAAAAHVDGVLGADWLARFEVELDVPQSRLGLWQTEGCGADFDPMAGRPHFILPFARAPGGHVLVPVFLDGVGMFALLDSGAAATIVTEQAAKAAGVTAAALAQDPSGVGRGVDLHRIPFRLHRFAEFRIGPERYPGAALLVGAVRVPVAGLLLGANYLARHRVWVSRAVPRVFIAPVP